MKLNFKLSALVALLSVAYPSVYAQDIMNPHNSPTAVNSNGTVGVQSSQDVGFDKKNQTPTQEKVMSEQNKGVNFIQKSKVFGEWLFNGSFAQNNIQGFNSNYKLSLGDKVIVKIWGAVDQELHLVVDKQGNIFIPEIGPLKVVGIENGKLNGVVSSEIKKVYKNVQSYVTLDNEQPVKVYVAGFAQRPGLYTGLSSDSLLYYIDKAGGIDPNRGSFLDVIVLRNNEIKEKINLYDFVLEGKISSIQFMDGDVIQIVPRKGHVLVSGDVRNAFEFEFNESIKLSDIVRYSQPETSANKIFVTRKNGSDIKTFSYDLAQAEKLNFNLENDDEVSILKDKKLNTVSIRVEGEHDSGVSMVLPNGATVQDLVDQLKKNDRTDLSSLQLYRLSVKQKQKESILDSIRILETNMLSSTSSTKNMADLREKETTMLLKLIDSAKKVEPKGQVILEKGTDFAQVFLEDGDVIKIAGKNSLVNISGQILQPTALVFNKDMSVQDYIDFAGGFLANADKDKVLVKRSSGAIKIHESGVFSSGVVVAKGDEIMVLPKVDMKNTQWIKDITELIYQVAVGAAVILKF